MKPLNRFTILSVTLLLAMGCQAVVNGQSSDELAKREVLTTGINHVGLTVRDLKASVAFFTDVLDWQAVGGFADYPSVFVTDGNLFVTLWQAEDPDKAVAFNRKRNVGLHHLAISVSRFEALDVLHARFLEADGVVIEFSPELNGPGPTKHMMIREPSGNRLEFTYSPPR